LRSIIFTLAMKPFTLLFVLIIYLQGSTWGQKLQAKSEKRFSYFITQFNRRGPELDRATF
jgi:hypothetical protein